MATGYNHFRWRKSSGSRVYPLSSLCMKSTGLLIRGLTGAHQKWSTLFCGRGSRASLIGWNCFGDVLSTVFKRYCSLCVCAHVPVCVRVCVCCKCMSKWDAHAEARAGRQISPSATLLFITLRQGLSQNWKLTFGPAASSDSSWDQQPILTGNSHIGVIAHPSFPIGSGDSNSGLLA